MDPNPNALHLLHTISASPERVFEAWTTREHMEHWTHPTP